MRPPRYVSYLRVSTERQGFSGLSLEAQRTAVRAHIANMNGTLLAEIVEVESGTRCDREGLNEAIRLCRIRRASLIIAKLDRLARNVAFISSLIESGTDFVAVDFPQANRLTIHILAAVAEYEASAISTRTKAALAVARAQGRRLGGDRGNFRTISSLGPLASAKVRANRAAQQAADLAPILEQLRNGGKSLREIAIELNAKQIVAPRGGKWYATQVKRLFERLSKMSIEDADRRTRLLSHSPAVRETK